MKTQPSRAISGIPYKVLIFLTALTICLTSCVVPTSLRVHVDSPYQGMRSTQEDTIRILITHGMGPQNEKKGPFQQPLVEGIYKQMEGKKTKKIETAKVIKWYDERIILTIQEAQGEGRFYQFYSVSWYKFNQQRRDSFFCEDFDKRRLLLSRLIKKKVLTDGLTDVVKYTRDDFQDTIQKPFVEALSRMFLKRNLALGDSISNEMLRNENNQNQSSDFFFVTGSLGSKIVYDQLMRVIRVAQGMQQSPTPKTINFFMLSNQLNLFQDLEISKSDVIAIPVRVRKSIKKINIVAFNDPNDVLGFHIPQNLVQPQDTGRISIANVSMHNAKWHFPFLFSNVIKAHDGAKKNGRIHKYIVKDSVAVKGNFRKIKKNKGCH